MGEQKVQDHLAVQDAKTVDASKLTALTPEVVSLSFHVIQCWSLIPFTGAVWRRQLRALFFDGVFFLSGRASKVKVCKYTSTS